MTIAIDLFPEYELTNMTSIFFEVIIGITLGFLIYLMDRRNSKKQEEIISKIGNYADTQEKGLRLLKVEGLSKISLGLLKITIDYRRELAKISLTNLSSKEQLILKNSLIRSAKNKEIMIEIREEGFKISHLSKLAESAVVLAGMFQTLSMSTNKEDDYFMMEKMNLSANSIIELAELIHQNISSEMSQISRK
ncbi:MAG: hypothetical protein P0116_12320 [Candidatus Nitrosocosmicus sp.]|nr:hypothetical protein [Candidatus Nitrosocosmicus sp.]